MGRAGRQGHGDLAQDSCHPSEEPEWGFEALQDSKVRWGIPGATEGSVPTGPFWLVNRSVRLLPSMLATLMLSPSVQYSFL